MIDELHLPKKDWSRCNTKLPAMQHMFQPIPGTSPHQLCVAFMQSGG